MANGTEYPYNQKFCYYLKAIILSKSSGKKFEVCPFALQNELNKTRESGVLIMSEARKVQKAMVAAK